jgi:hypothetical protein
MEVYTIFQRRVLGMPARRESVSVSTGTWARDGYHPKRRIIKQAKKRLENFISHAKSAFFQNINPLPTYRFFPYLCTPLKIN